MEQDDGFVELPQLIDHPVKLFQHFIDRIMRFDTPVNLFGEADNFRYILFLAIKTDAGVEGNTINPCRYFTLFPVFWIGFPKVQHNILVKVVERGIGIGLQIRHLIDHPFIFTDD